MNIKVSIIVPMYNAEKYIGDCMQSLVNQSYRDIEIILIDDCSSDESVDIVEKYMKKDKRIRLIRQKHAGPNGARKVGVREATGDYIMFVDADDYIELNAVSILVEKATYYDIDSIRFRATSHPDGLEVCKISGKISDRTIINNNDVCEILLTTNWLNNLWLQFYKADRLKKIKAFELNIDLGEDYLVNLELHSKTDKMLILDDVLYHYRINPKSITHSTERKRVLMNISDRLFISKMAILAADDYSSDFRSAVIYAQAKMIRQYILGVARIDGYNYDRFLKDFRGILTKDRLPAVDLDELNKYMRLLSFSERAKYRKIVNAIFTLNYDYIWKYICLYKIVRSIHI